MKNRTRLIRKITNLLGIGFIMFGVIPVSIFSQVGSVYAAEQAEDGAAAIVLPAFTSYAGLLEGTSEDPPAEEPADAPPAEEPADEAPAEEPADEVPTASEIEETTPVEDTEGGKAEVNAPEEEAEGADVSEDPISTEVTEAECVDGEKTALPEVSEVAEEETALPNASEVTEEEKAEPEAVEDLSKLVEVLSESEVQLIDENGEPLPLASKEAAEVLANSDPFFWDGAKWVGYTKSGTGCPANVTCIQNDFPFQEAVNQAGGAGNMIYVASGTYDEDVVVGAGSEDLSFTAFHTITVATTHTTPVYTSGYALLNSITLNVNFGTTEGVYADEVIVNEFGTAHTGGWLNDGMALVNDGGTIEADVDIYGADGHYRVRDANHHSINFEWECGEPDEYIYPGRQPYRMILKDPSHEEILGYYEVRTDERSDNLPHLENTPLSAEDRLEDLVIGVNLAEDTGWTHGDEERIYWYLLGDIGKTLKNNPYPDSQQERADEITRGVHDGIAKDHSIWFLWPKAEGQQETPVSPENRQLTFFVYETRVVDGCTDPEAKNYDPNATDEDGSCAYPATPPVTPPATTTTTTTTTAVTPPATTTTTAAALFDPFIIPVTGQFPLITAGIGHTCALTAKEGLECWGLNESGQVGDSTFVDKLEPVDVAGIDPNTVIGLVSGIHHTCVLTSANEVYCWGLNSSGQLGDDTTENSNMPVLVDGLEGTVISISAGAEFTCALNSANEVFCWGNNSSGQLNDGTEEHSSIPVKTTTVSDDAVLISGGSTELQGITGDGAVQLWNSQPIIPVTGLPDEDNTFVSADRFTEGGCSMTNVGNVNCWGGITDAEVIGAVVSDMLASGEGHACTMKPEGLVCWGSNSNGQLGDDSTDDSAEETMVTELEQGVIALAAGMKHTCIIYEDETIACWGLNDFGQLGNSTTDDSKVPVETK